MDRLQFICDLLKITLIDYELFGSPAPSEIISHSNLYRFSEPLITDVTQVRGDQLFKSWVVGPALKDNKSLPLLGLRQIPRNRLKFYVVMLRVDGESVSFCPFCFRWEDPEGTSESFMGHGSHDFFHAQLCKFDRGLGNPDCDGEDSSVWQWLGHFDSVPAFPIFGQKPDAILISLLVSLYGLDVVNNVLNANNLGKHLADLLPEITYWEVRPKGAEKYYLKATHNSEAEVMNSLGPKRMCKLENPDSKQIWKT